MEKMKESLVKHLKGGEAFMPIEKMIEKIPFLELGKRPAGLPYSFYELFSHIRFTQKDILDYCTQANYEAPEWPQDYWPANSRPNDEKAWKELVDVYFRERDMLATLILSEEKDLMDTVPSGKKHTLLREVLLVIEHTTYHSGQLLILLRHLGLHSS
ncbi:DinB family protein [Salinimicrobium tongyeongense]|uniref:DinB family protein n=1 Tax=Salinimicrobium tongyeongense TaxID=2809707 RepID=A0ABY6NPV7_9FLAO|nr:DinB family protein [Salinimicrobium tongyeongense]UZH54919.1 DinB family protein [Salinimicrobium tongyeongense]